MDNKIKKIIERLVLEELAFIQESFRGFNLKKFKSLEKPEEMYKYAKKYLPILGKGSSRITFGLGSGKVLKLQWRGEIAGAQNKEEVVQYTNPKIPNELLPKLYDYEPNYEWIIVDAVQVIADNKQIRNLFSVSEAFLTDFIMTVSTNENYNFTEALQNSIEKTNTIPGVRKTNLNYLTKFDLELLEASFILTKNNIEDIERFDHWGFTTDGRLVVADYGIAV